MPRNESLMCALMCNDTERCPNTIVIRKNQPLVQAL
jgi:hypothetical protein